MTHLRSAGSQHSQQLVDFALFESYATYFNIGRTCFTAYSVLGKPMTFLIICILTKSRKPQIFSLRLFKSPIQKPQESCRKIRNTEIYSAGKIKSTSADNSGSAFFSLVEQGCPRMNTPPKLRFRLQMPFLYHPVGYCQCSTASCWR